MPYVPVSIVKICIFAAKIENIYKIIENETKNYFK